MGTTIQILVLLGIVAFLVLKLRNVLGTRDGFEPTKIDEPKERPTGNPDQKAVESKEEEDAEAFFNRTASAALALSAMKDAEPEFDPHGFIDGAKGAYEMILMAFEGGDLSEVKAFLADEVREAFEGAIKEREKKGYKIEASFIGIKHVRVVTASFDPESKMAEIGVRFVAEITSAVMDKSGKVIEGDPKKIEERVDVWTFGRKMASEDPNWTLRATGE